MKEIRNNIIKRTVLWMSMFSVLLYSTRVCGITNLIAQAAEKAVSYTHLDVYKRQGFNKGIYCGAKQYTISCVFVKGQKRELDFYGGFIGQKENARYHNSSKN